MSKDRVQYEYLAQHWHEFTVNDLNDLGADGWLLATSHQNWNWDGEKGKNLHPDKHVNMIFYRPLNQGGDSNE